MKTIIKILDKEFEIKSKLKEEGVKFRFCDEKDEKDLHNKFTISISRILNGTKITRRFCFYDCAYNYERGIKDLDENDLKFAFRCFIEDAFYATEGFEEFCSNLGYSPDSIRANKAYKECQKILNKLEDLGISRDELYNILEELTKMGI